jgi:hypothetical protein
MNNVEHKITNRLIALDASLTNKLNTVCDSNGIWSEVQTAVHEKTPRTLPIGTSKGIERTMI